MTLTRRTFIGYGAAGLGLGVAGIVGYQFRPVQPVDLLVEADPGAQVLVVYGSYTGSTGEQAGWLAKGLRAAGHKVDVLPVERAPDPRGYDAVIMGSAVHKGTWLPKMVDWAGDNRGALSGKSVALFQCSMRCAGLLQGDGALTTYEIEALTSDMGALIAAVPEAIDAPRGFFPGRVDYDHLPPTIRLGYPIMSWTTMLGDYRDPAMVAGYAQDLAAQDSFAKLLV